MEIGGRGKYLASVILEKSTLLIYLHAIDYKDSPTGWMPWTVHSFSNLSRENRYRPEIAFSFLVVGKLLFIAKVGQISDV